MEQLLHYVWKHKIFPLKELKTTTGQQVEVIDTGLANTDAGPDFFNAKLKLDGVLWIGNIEIHERSSDWFKHGHHADAGYNSVILHIASEIDTEISRSNGERIPQIQLICPEAVRTNYKELLETDSYPPCYRIIPSLPPFTAHSWMTAFQIEAIFFGQAGILEDSDGDGYYLRLKKEYTYLQHKFGLIPMDASLWRFLRLRPANFPHIRIAQLACLYHRAYGLLSRIMETETLQGVRDILKGGTSEYWLTHYTFGGSSPSRPKTLSNTSLDLLIINTVVTFLYAYGLHKGNRVLCARAGSFLEELKAENNYITRMWEQCGMKASNAADSQALIQLKKEYCDKKKCLYCRIGYEYLKRS